MISESQALAVFFNLLHFEQVKCDSAFEARIDPEISHGSGTCNLADENPPLERRGVCPKVLDDNRSIANVILLGKVRPLVKPGMSSSAAVST